VRCSQGAILGKMFRNIFSVCRKKYCVVEAASNYFTLVRSGRPCGLESATSYASSSS